MENVSYYFDHGATTPLRAEVLEAMIPYLTEVFGNPSSLHQIGLRAKEALEDARTLIATTIGAGAREIIFTGSGTEANNIAILGSARRLRKLGNGNHLITSKIEHPSVLKAMQRLEKEGFEVTYLSVDESGQVDLQELRDSIKNETISVSIMHANNVIGTIQPVKTIAKIAKEKGIIFHTDAVQSFGKLSIHVDDLACDLLTLNAHKIGGPKGVAALFIRKGNRLDPIGFGGNQERGIRPATQNVAGIVGFAKAAELAASEQEKEYNRLISLRSYFIHQLINQIKGIKINGHSTNTLPNLINISIENIEGQGLMLELDRLGFSTSSGSACSSTDHEPSYVLLAIHPSRQHALESLRITMGRATTMESVDAFINGLKKAVNYWRSA